LLEFIKPLNKTGGIADASYWYDLSISSRKKKLDSDYENCYFRRAFTSQPLKAMERERTEVFIASIVGLRVPHVVHEYTLRELQGDEWLEIGKEYRLAISDDLLNKIGERIFEIAKFNKAKSA